MPRLIRYLFLAGALLFSQHATMLHGLAHAAHELETAAHRDGVLPDLDHGVDVCAAFGALAHALGNAVLARPCAGVRAGAPVATFEFIAVPARIVFDPRAPPLSA